MFSKLTSSHLFLVPRPWKPPPPPPLRRCSACLYSNDSDANYCQTCGTLTDLRLLLRSSLLLTKPRSRSVSMSFSLFSAQSLMNDRSQRWSSTFSSSWVLSPPRTVASCTAQDIVNFLISKDNSVRTVAHPLSCSKRD